MANPETNLEKNLSLFRGLKERQVNIDVFLDAIPPVLCEMGGSVTVGGLLNSERLLESLVRMKIQIEAAEEKISEIIDMDNGRALTKVKEDILQDVEGEKAQVVKKLFEEHLQGIEKCQLGAPHIDNNVNSSNIIVDAKKNNDRKDFKSVSLAGGFGSEFDGQSKDKCRKGCKYYLGRCLWTGGRVDSSCWNANSEKWQFGPMALNFGLGPQAAWVEDATERILLDEGIEEN